MPQVNSLSWLNLSIKMTTVVLCMLVVSSSFNSIKKATMNNLNMMFFYII